MSLIIFDFDGVLAIPHTHPEEHYPQIPHLIKILASKYTLALASFNPRASIVLKEWSIDQYFSAIPGNNRVVKGQWYGSIALFCFVIF